MQNIISEATVQGADSDIRLQLSLVRRFQEVGVGEYELREVMLSQMNVTSVLTTLNRYRGRTVCEYIGHCQRIKGTIEIYII